MSAKRKRKPDPNAAVIFVPLRPDMPAVDATLAILRRLRDNIVTNAEAVLTDDDPQYLHDFRVSVRRTRCALGQIKAVLPQEKVDEFRTRFAALARTTNRLRDLDIYLLQEASSERSLPAALRAEMAPLYRHFRRERDVEAKRAHNELLSPQYRLLIADWNRFLVPCRVASAIKNEKILWRPEPKCGMRRAALAQSPAAGAPPKNARKPVLKIARKRLRRNYQKVLRLGQEIGGDTPSEVIHRLRIECKKLRYLIEFFASLFAASDVETWARRMKKLQERLGRHQDLWMQEKELARFAESDSTAERKSRRTVMALEAALAAFDRERREIREGFALAFAEVASASAQREFERLLGD